MFRKLLDNWESMDAEQQKQCAKINNFFSGLHLVVVFPEVVSPAQLKFEKTFAENQEKPQEESATIQHVKTSSTQMLV